MSSTTRILILGASGYIGGSILARLLEHPDFSSFEITAFIRDEEKRDGFASLGVTPVVGDMADLELLETLAEAADYVINTLSVVQRVGLPLHTVPAHTTILKGLKKRYDATGKKPTFVHTSGGAMFIDGAQGKYASETIFYDSDPAQIESLPPTSPHRDVDPEIVRASEEGYVSTHIVVPPSVYSLATGRLVDMGLQRRLTVPTPILVKESLLRGATIGTGEGKNVWSYVHVDDCADFYITLLAASLSGATLPTGREGFFVVETSEHTSGEVSTIIAQTLKELGKLPSGEIRAVGENESPTLKFMISFTSANARCRGVRAREIGWKPRYSEADFAKGFKEDVVAIVESL